MDPRTLELTKNGTLLPPILGVCSPYEADLFLSRFEVEICSRNISEQEKVQQLLFHLSPARRASPNADNIIKQLPQPWTYEVVRDELFKQWFDDKSTSVMYITDLLQLPSMPTIPDVVSVLSTYQGLLNRACRRDKWNNRPDLIQQFVYSGLRRIVPYELKEHVDCLIQLKPSTFNIIHTLLNWERSRPPIEMPQNPGRPKGRVSRQNLMT